MRLGSPPQFAQKVRNAGRRARLLAAAAFLSLATSFVLHASEPVISTRTLKAALILRLIDFVEWPPPTQRTATNSAFTVCVIGDTFLSEALREASRTMKSGGKPVEIWFNTSLKGAASCRILVLGEYDERQFRAFLVANAGNSILTVGGTDEFLAAGGIVRIRLQDARVNIDLNPHAASVAKLRISSRLLRLANLTSQPDFPPEASVK